MKKYNLYLDESETHHSGNNRIFCIAGVIIEEAYNNTVIPAFNNIKKLIWRDLPNPEDVILHEKDVRFANNQDNRNGLNKIKSEHPLS